MIQPPGPPSAFRHENNLGTGSEPQPLDDVAGEKSDLGIVVPRIKDPVTLASVRLTMKARLLAVTTEHLRQLGPKRVTLMAVAAEAGTTHSNVYRYFASRDALVDAVADRWLREVEAELARIADAPDPADDKIEHLLTALASLQRKILAHEPNLFAVHLDATMRSRPIARRHRAHLRGFVERIVEEGIAACIFAARDPKCTVAYILDASYRFTHPLPIQHDGDLPRDLVDARLGAVILAIKKVLRTGMV